MNLITTGIYEQIAAAWLTGKRHIWVEGGTYASKTYSILQFLILVAQHSLSPMISSIVSESVPHLKRGCIRDFMNIVGDEFEPARWNKTDSIYTFGLGKVEFFSADEPAKLRGGRRKILFINEANNLSYDSFRELDARTELLTVCDWNPTSEFWYHQNGLGASPDSAYIHATYKDALNVTPAAVVKNILAMGALDANWANVYLEGRLGKVEGLVYPRFDQVDALPAGDIIYGLDFGFSDDPVALVGNVFVGDSLYSKEYIYSTGLTNDVLARDMDLLRVKQRYDEIFADSAEPKSIQELCEKGFNVKPAEKGQGSVDYGIQKVKQFKQFWTKDSLNCIKEQRNFRYITDKDGRLTEKTTHRFSHGLDARRYAVSSYAFSRGGKVSAKSSIFI